MQFVLVSSGETIRMILNQLHLYKISGQVCPQVYVLRYY